MGRDYTKKDGKKTLLPTERQLAKIAEQAKLLSAIKQIELKEFSLATRMLIVREVNKLSPAERAKILETGEATDKFIRIKAAEAIEGYKKDPNWVGKNERDDPQNPNNINAFEKRIRDLPYEVAVQYDRHNRFLGYNVGDAGTVKIISLRGTLIGGTSMHNHPRAEGRPLGQHPSGADWIAKKAYGSATTVITSAEGKYIISSRNGLSKVPDSALKGLDAKVSKAWKSSIDVARKVFPLRSSNENDKKYSDFKHRLIHASVSKIYAGFAKTHGIKFEFKPHKGYESLVNPTQGSLLNPLP